MFRFLTIFMLLLAQAWPLAAMSYGDAHNQDNACPQVSCCEPQTGAETSVHCCCMTSPERQAPENLPAPVSAPTGRDLIPQPQWIDLSECLFIQPQHALQTGAAAMAHDNAMPCLTARKLPVLFCSILI